MKSIPLTALSAALPWLSASAGPPITLDTRIHHLEDRRVIIEHIPAIQLPDPPEPVAKPEPESKTSEQLALLASKWQADRDSNPTIHAGATVYRLPDGTTVTHVNRHLTELQQAYANLEATRAARRAELEADPPQPRDIHLRVSRLTKAQAAAWHQHATERKGGRQ